MHSYESSVSGDEVGEIDAVVAHCCGTLRASMTRLLRHSVMAQGGSHAATKSHRSTPSLADAMHRTAAEVDRVAHLLDSTVHQALVRLREHHTESLEDLRASSQLLAADAIVGEEGSAAMATPQAWKSLLDDHNYDARSRPLSGSPVRLAKLQRWLADEVPLSGPPCPAAGGSFGLFKPSVAPIIAKQMLRWEMTRDSHGSVSGNDDMTFADVTPPPACTATATGSRPPSALSRPPSVPHSRPQSPITYAASGVDAGNALNTSTNKRPMSGRSVSSSGSPSRPPSAKAPVGATTLPAPSSAGSGAALSRTSSGLSRASAKGAEASKHPPHLEPPVPYCFAPIPREQSVSWWHRVVLHLQRGRGTTVVQIQGSSIGSQTLEAMRAELGSEPSCISDLAEAVFASIPGDSTLYWIAVDAEGCREHSWKDAAVGRQRSRQQRRHPGLFQRAASADRRAKYLLAEKLSFSVDRPAAPGILRLLFEDGQLGKNAKMVPVPLTATYVGSIRTLTGRVVDHDTLDSAPLCEPEEQDATMRLLPIPLVPPPEGLPLPLVVVDPLVRFGDEDHYHECRGDDGDVEFPWVMIDVSPHMVAPTAYAVVSAHPFHAGCAPRNWVLEGSANGGLSWTTLRDHVDDDAVGKGTDFAIFDIPPIPISIPSATAQPTQGSPDEQRRSSCATLAATISSTSLSALRVAPTAPFCGSQFRIRITGKNATGSASLQISSIELYGRLLAVGHDPAQALAASMATISSAKGSARSARSPASSPREQRPSTPLSSRSTASGLAQQANDELVNARVFGSTEATPSIGTLLLKSSFAAFSSLPPPPAAKKGGGKKK